MIRRRLSVPVAVAARRADAVRLLEREGITSSKAMAKALNERGVATAHSGRWGTKTVSRLRRRLKRLRL